MGKIEKEDPELWAKITIGDDSIRGKAKKLTQTQQKFYEAGRLGMIIDGVGHSVSDIKKKKESLDWFEKAFEANDPNMPYLKVDPIFEILYEEPRYQLLLKKMGL